MRSIDKATGRPAFRPVYLFGHRDPSRPSRFVNLGVTGSPTPLQLSPTHFIPICTSGCDATATVRWTYKYAKDVRVGDIVMAFQQIEDGSNNMSATAAAAGVDGAAGAASPADSGIRLARVEYTTMSLEAGLFNPYVRGADIVVDGIVASPHSTWLLDDLFAAYAPAAATAILPAIYEVRPRCSLSM